MRERAHRLDAWIIALAAALACSPRPTTAADGGAAATTSAGAGSAVRWGVARTAGESARCREEEVARFERRDARISVERGTTVLLRAAPATLPPGGCAAAAHQYNFFLAEANAQGCFVNAFADRTEETVVDRATGLMWQRKASREISFDRAKRYVADLNARRFGGHLDWRLPTAEELLSLVETARFQTTRLDPVLFSRENEYWSADVVPGAPAQWAVDTLLPGCTPAQWTTELPVRAVRAAGTGR